MNGPGVSAAELGDGFDRMLEAFRDLSARREEPAPLWFRFQGNNQARRWPVKMRVKSVLLSALGGNPVVQLIVGANVAAQFEMSGLTVDFPFPITIERGVDVSVSFDTNYLDAGIFAYPE